MSTDRHARVSELFVAARKLSGDARARLLDDACAGDTALRAEIESLLAHDASRADFLDQSACHADSRIGPGFVQAAMRELMDESLADAGTTSCRNRASRTDAVSRAPAQIGPFDIQGVLGEGGMGVVYVAQQQSPKRRVALKVIRAALFSPSAAKRFEHEAQTLARLQHPGIAQIYECGVADSSAGPQPYLAMELIEGRPLTRYAQEHGLETRQRLDLMIRVCEAAHHAHQKGVIHRDLKPANIFVDAAGQPKVLDFGVARWIGPDASLSGLTASGQLVGTLGYMSPEQVDTSADDVDTRSDVFALGLILYEMLSGRPAQDVRGRSLPEAVRIIRESDPPSLSALDRAFRGDINIIVRKAIEKERERRYSTALELASDLRRHLAHEPIVAHPASRAYRLAKFTRRHRALVAGTALAFISLAVGLAVATWQTSRARDEAAKARAVTDFLRRMIASADALGGGRDAKIIDAVDRVEAALDAPFEAGSLVAAALHHEVGNVYYSLGVWDKAERHLDAAIAIRRAELGNAGADTLASISRLGLLRNKQGRACEAEPLLRQVYDHRRRILGDAQPDTMIAANDLAAALQPQGKLEEAERLLRAALAGQERALGRDHDDALSTAVNLASVLRQKVGRSMVNGAPEATEAEALYRRAIDGLRRAHGERYPATLLAMANLARLLKDLGRFSEAVPLYRQAFNGMNVTLGADHPETLIAMANLGRALLSSRELEEAEALYRTARERFSAVFGERDPKSVTVTAQLGLVLKERGELAESRILLTEAVAEYRRLYGDEDAKTVELLGHLRTLERPVTTSMP